MKELVKIEKDLKTELTLSEKFACKTKSDFEDGGLALKAIKSKEKELKLLKDKALKPSLETTNQIREYFRPTEKKLMVAISQIKDEMDRWYTAELAKAEEKKAKVLDDRRITKSETLERKLEETTVDVGNTRRQRVVEVTDLSKIPLIYFDLNEARLKLDLLDGREIPGVRLVNKTIITA